MLILISLLNAEHNHTDPQDLQLAAWLSSPTVKKPVIKVAQRVSGCCGELRAPAPVLRRDKDAGRGGHGGSNARGLERTKGGGAREGVMRSIITKCTIQLQDVALFVPVVRSAGARERSELYFV